MNVYFGTGSLLFVGNGKFRATMNERVGRKYIVFPCKNELFNYAMFIDDNFPDLAPIPFIVTKGYDVTSEGKMG